MNKRRILTLIAIIPLIIVTRAQTAQFTDTTYFTDNSQVIKSIIQYQVHQNDTNREGSALYFYENGKTWQKGFHKDDKMDSLWQIYFPNGKISSEKVYRQGLKNGGFINYYENGVVKTRGTYRNDSLTGVMTLYYAEGQANEIRNYEGNKLNGLMTGYYPNGNLNYRINYVDSIQDGLYERYYSSGKLKEKGLDRIWVTPKDPFMIPMTLGIVFSVIVGNLVALAF